MEICKDYKVSRWRALKPRLENGSQVAWEEAIGVFERRLNERFFRCMHLLLNADESRSDGGGHVVPGFALMALCCLIVETLQSFYRGGRAEQQDSFPRACTYPVGNCIAQPSTARAFKDFLKDSPRFKDDFKNSEIRGDFSQNVRNAILHEAETRGG